MNVCSDRVPSETDKQPNPAHFRGYQYLEYVENREEQNEAFERADEADMPTMFVRPWGEGEKDWFGEVDAICSGGSIDEETHHQITDIQHDYLEEESVYEIACCHGLFSLKTTDWDMVRDWALDVAPIVFDTGNWEKTTKSPEYHDWPPEE